MIDPPMGKHPILLLAAGQSSRMRGRDKLLETVDGVPLVQRQAHIARCATTGPVFVTLPHHNAPRLNALKGCDVQIVQVPDATDGLSASLRRGLQALPAETEAVMILLADLPELTALDLRTVFAAMDPPTNTLIWRGATQTRAPGHPIVFSRTLFEPLQQLTGDTGGAEVVAQYQDQVHLVPLPGERARRDLDTPEDWANWRTTLPG